MKAFIDMDGVIADFIGAALVLHGRPELYTLASSKGVWDTEKLLGITAKEFWEPLNGAEFWSKLPKTPEADGIVALVEAAVGKENVAILTAPASSENCIPGKYKWIRRHFPQFSKRIIFASCKEFMASPERILIDDRDSNVDAFNYAGGKGLLLARDWNQDHKYADDTLDRLWWGLRLKGIKV